MYSQYMYNMTSINPAYAGNRGVPSLAFIWREQWAGLSGAPSTKSITLDVPTKNKKYGLGVQVFDDRYANVIRRTGMNLFYNVKIPISDRGVLSVGVKGGFYNDLKLLTSVNLGKIASYDMAYASNFNKIIPLMGVGAYYNSDKFYLGVSAPDLILLSQVKNYKTDSSLFQVNEVHYFMTTGYSFNVDEDIVVKPSVLLKMASGAPVEADINMGLWYRNTIGIGGSYRTGESILGMIELQLTPQLRFGYSYDMPFRVPNTSEIFLRLEFGSLFPNSKSFKIY
jgi:type IX secretion system PorP/SprF family membrane protein